MKKMTTATIIVVALAYVTGFLVAREIVHAFGMQVNMSAVFMGLIVGFIVNFFITPYVKAKGWIH